jgi:hypothetical protein
MSSTNRFTLARNTVALQPNITLVGAPKGQANPINYISQAPECWLELNSCNFTQLLISAQVFSSIVAADRTLKVYSSLTPDVAFSTAGIPQPAEELLSVKFTAAASAASNAVTLTIDNDKLGRYLFWVIQLALGSGGGEPYEEYACFEINVTVL